MSIDTCIILNMSACLGEKYKAILHVYPYQSDRILKAEIPSLKVHL